LKEAMLMPTHRYKECAMTLPHPHCYECGEKEEHYDHDDFNNWVQEVRAEAYQKGKK
jgi:hypothetical protein